MNQGGHFTQIGGAMLNSFNVTWPFATLSVTSDSILLWCLGREYLFPKTKIIRLRRYNGFLSTGLQIGHTEQSFPHFVVFWASIFSWSSGFKRLKSSLADLGYEVQP
jgi:hypothetical protein